MDDCGIPLQASHTGGDNIDIECMLPPKQNYQVHFNRDPGLRDSLDYSNHVNHREPRNSVE